MYNKIKAIIVDDEPNGIAALQWEVERASKEVMIVATFTHPEDVITYLATNSIELMFLDIQMPKFNGFELLDRLQTIDFHVIFVTSFDNFALKAFKYSALDYLVKPADKESVSLAIEKYKKIDQRPGFNFQQQLAIAQESLTLKKTKKVVFSTKESYEFIAPEAILYCESDSNYTTLFMRNDTKLVVSKPLKEVEGMLSSLGFFRVHQSYLVQLSCVLRFIKSDGGMIELSNKKLIPVSNSKKNSLLEQLNSQ